MTSTISFRHAGIAVLATCAVALLMLVIASPAAKAGSGTVGFKSRITLQYLPDEGTMLAQVHSKSKRCRRGRPVVLRLDGDFFARETTSSKGFAGFSEMFPSGKYKVKVQRGVFHLPSGKSIRCSADESPAVNLL